MTDSVAVFPPGYRLTDSSTGAPLSGAVLEFYDAGTTTPKTVYADADLATSIGTTVTTDSLGYPTSDGGTTKSLVFVGVGRYKIVVKTSTGATVATHDDLPGAVETFDSSDVSVSATRPVVTKSLDYTILAADQNTLFAGNCSSADVVFTLPSAATVGTGWEVAIQHAGSANQVRINTVSSQTLSSGVTSFSTIGVLSFSGEEVTLTSDGANWRMNRYVSPNIKRSSGVLTIADRLTSPPGSEINGALYLISGSPSGGWSSFSAQDIVQYTNSAWVRFTPPADCGWIAYVQDEDAFYCMVGSAWVELAATQANMETGTDVARFVTPGRQKFHPLHVKAVAHVTFSGGTPSLNTTHSSGFSSSITDTGNGDITLTLSAAMASAVYAVVATAEHNATSNARYCHIHTKTTTTIRVIVFNVSATLADPDALTVIVLGDI